MFDENKKENQEPEEEYSYVFNKEPKKKNSHKNLILPYLLSIISICLCIFMFTNMNSSSNTVILYENTDSTSEIAESDTNSTINSTNQLESAIASTKESVVQISSDVSEYSMFGTVSGTSAGSGVIISTDGYIVTNQHVIANATNTKVTLFNGETYDTTLIGEDETNDIAILKIDAENLVAATLGDSTTISLGESIYTIGNPLGTLGGTVTAGIISATSRYITVEDNADEMLVIQIDAAISPGNSGGGLFDLDGNLIGIVNAKSSSDEAEGIGFAIPISNAKSVIEDLIQFGSVQRPAIGITVVEVNSEQGLEYNNVKKYGVYIQSISLTSDAKIQGLKTGDRITEIDGTIINTSSNITDILNDKEVGDTITITVERDSTFLTYNVLLKASTN